MKCDCIFSTNFCFVKQKPIPDEITNTVDDAGIQIHDDDINRKLNADHNPQSKFIDPTEDVLFDSIDKIKDIVFMKNEERAPSSYDYKKIKYAIISSTYEQTIEYLLNLLQNKLLERNIVGCISNIYFIILKGREFYYNILENPETYNQISDTCNRDYFLCVDRHLTTHQYYIRK